MPKFIRVLASLMLRSAFTHKFLVFNSFPSTCMFVSQSIFVIYISCTCIRLGTSIFVTCLTKQVSLDIGYMIHVMYILPECNVHVLYIYINVPTCTCLQCTCTDILYIFRHYMYFRQFFLLQCTTDNKLSDYSQ